VRGFPAILDSASPTLPNEHRRIKRAASGSPSCTLTIVLYCTVMLRERTLLLGLNVWRDSTMLTT
jgi:hypothetical protein